MKSVQDKIKDKIWSVTFQTLMKDFGVDGNCLTNQAWKVTPSVWTQLWRRVRNTFNR